MSAAKWVASSNTYLEQIQNYTGDKSLVTDIVICAGANDTDSAAADINMAMSSFANYAKANYPYAKLWLGWVGFGVDHLGTTGAINAYEAYKNCGAYGFAYMANMIASFHNYEHIEDNWLHPSAAGCRTIGWSAATILSGGYYDSAMYDSSGWEIARSGLLVPIRGTTGSQGNCFQHFEGDNIVIQVKRAVFDYGAGTPLVFTNDTEVCLGYWDKTYFRPASKTYATPGVIEYTVDGTTWASASGFYTFKYENGNTGVYFCSNSGSFNARALCITFKHKCPLIMC